ncbi:VTT domain-containing protein [Desulfurivibrio alkaliphilus]|uniref:SNARE associated Golgi protein-related protein n=1 Tax=Desulfurivibrio alkaliphilus (strain DSM 19089 / UNIQEM U267 / AHT2) TaxID=589865 RepID=D6Z1I8_DESAT|nr:VTT domain-containing protein [Desulfurivibrio alkaliphilus]ADH87322.1 SNARE associated Golgi protein-related protein [Desulfurivibrio alkaliphilus AHT 2]
MNTKKIALAGILLLLAGAFFWFELHHWLTLAQLRDFQVQATAFYEQRPLSAIALFVLAYLLVVALNLPGGALLGLLAGAVFGVLVGTVVVSFASTIAATVACALCRYLFRDLVRARFPQVAVSVDRGIAREGAFYLFSLRLIPAVPFFVINMVMGLTAMPLRTFYWVSQLGMLPGTFVFVNAGRELGQLTATGDIFSLRLVLAFALLGLLPLLAKWGVDFYRRRSGRSGEEEKKGVQQQSPDQELAEHHLAAAAEQLDSGCTRCGACAARCAFLQTSGLPGEIAAAWRTGKPQADPFACSLCNLCTVVCPEKLKPGDFLLDLRRHLVRRQVLDLRPYRPLLSYERLGASPWFAAAKLPAHCDTVFFPGCNLPGSRPAATWQLFNRLQGQCPNLGLVLNCCHKPSHDLGRQDYFNHRFTGLQQHLLRQGIRRVLVACPNCYKVFLNYGGELQVESVWEMLAAPVAAEAENAAREAAVAEAVATPPGEQVVTIHDPCPLRQLPALQQAVRRLAQEQGLRVKEMRASGRRTFCCGEGGAVGFKRPELAARWGELRREQAGELPVLTYCAGCAGFLTRAGLPTIHLADLLAEPRQALAGKAPVAKGLRTYLNRLLFKWRLWRFKPESEQAGKRGI